MNEKDVTSIRIDAVDTLFFRDGKPFTMGGETWADGMFPPSPSVVYGALRNQYFGEHSADLSLANEPDDPTRDLTIMMMALLREERVLFPLPLDYVKDKEQNRQEGILLSTRKSAPISNCPVSQVFVAQDDQVVETVDEGILTDSALKRYLSSTSETVQYNTLKEYMVPEPKIGIARNNVTHIAEEGMLYRIDMRRLAAARKFGEETVTLALYVEFSDLDISERGVFRLGGEGKMVQYTPFTAKLLPPRQLQGNRFKLYLATPALFEQGWLPSWIDPNTLRATGQYEELKMTLETAIIGKPLAIGGFDMKARQPKVMRQAVPAGSVYIFTLDGDIQQAVSMFHHQRISDFEARQGFGLTFVGGVQ